MKDNEKNLSNELNDDATESVAAGKGGTKNGWTEEQRNTFACFYAQNTPFSPNRKDDIDEIFRCYTPAQYFSGENPTIFNARQLAKLKKLLKIK